MDKKNVIIIFLIVIILVLVAVMGVLFLHPTSVEKQDCELKISNKTLYEGDSLKIKLTDLNSTPLANKTVVITIVNKNGKVVVNKSVNTNSNGSLKTDLDLKEEDYNISVNFKGDDNYNGVNLTQKLKIKEKEVPTESTSSQSSYSGSRYIYDEGGKYDTSTGRYVGGQHDGATKEQVAEYNWKITHEGK